MPDSDDEAREQVIGRFNAGVAAFAEKVGFPLEFRGTLTWVLQDWFLLAGNSKLWDIEDFEYSEAFALGISDWAKIASVHTAEGEKLALAVEYRDGLLQITVRLGTALLAQAIPVEDQRYVFRDSERPQHLLDRQETFEQLYYLVYPMAAAANLSLEGFEVG